jgi:hypothetical protein
MLLVNCVVIVCLFAFRRLDDNESQEKESWSPPRNGDGDQLTQDEDKDYFYIAKRGKPSFESYPDT